MKHQFHEGDIVRLRDIDSLCAEYGYCYVARGEAIIKCPFGLLSSAYEKLCEREIEIKNIQKGYSLIAGRGAWYICVDQINIALEILEPCTIDIDLPIIDSDLAQFTKGYST